MQPSSSSDPLANKPESSSAGYRSNWRNPFVWLIVALPASAVVASVITAVIAISGADPVISTREPARVIQAIDPMLPAQKARNRAAEAKAP